MLVTLSVSSFLMWRRCKPEGQLGAPPVSATPAKLRGFAVLLSVLAALLPLLAGSLVLLLLVERLVFTRLPVFAAGLGLPVNSDPTIAG